MNLKQHIESLFKNTKFSDENNNLFVNKIFEAIEKIDNEFVEILLADDIAKKTFFSKIKDTYVMNQFKLIDFFSMNNYFEESYTSYTNKIGLIRKDDFIKKNNDVVLAFPYKDCVLEGGQTKEDQKGKENFFNEILDSDEIDRLFEPKVLTNIKRYSKDGIEENPTITDKDNLILKGNNLLALHSLKKKYAGKVKLIYIDPPYNTGSDSFKYNDSFNHSTWLTFMKNRLEVARELLRDDGVIFVQCDDNEQAYLKVLMDEVFGCNSFLNTVAIKMSEASGTKMAHVDSRFPKIKEYIHIFKKSDFKIDEIDYISKDKWDTEYKTIIENFTIQDRKTIRNIQDQDINTKEDVKVVQSIFNKIKLTPLHKYNDFEDSLSWKQKNAFRIIRTVSSDSLRKIVKSYSRLPNSDLGAGLSNDNLIFFYNTKSNLNSQGRVQVVFADDFLKKHPCDMWYDIKTTGIAKEGNVTLQYGKKPEKILERIIKMSTSSNDLVLDFFMGSGTTCAVAHKMGRQYIGIEQMDYIEDITVERMKKVIDGEQGGISKSVNWQGGGDFVYAELKQIPNFDKSNSRLKQEMRYLPIGELEDKDYKISKEEIAINKAFYGVDDE